MVTDTRACRKARYADHLAADFALVRIGLRRRSRAKDEVRSYHCPACGGWHLTSWEASRGR